ncbi:hypothetical protein POM88_051237 [Heracleum sosnowskyi]|uniref:Amidase domain-containing protein n=1 Tax=Heracleum sosnowskyi TaxID=360622 RepID=A0AAD8H054_9APIA|nr:hypothetical protein POM88_051237 [Heracleum sosnowskyi]
MTNELSVIHHKPIPSIGPLHGKPYGLKEIIVVPQYKTTWGSNSFKDQVLDIEAWVYKRITNFKSRNAGAVLVAKIVSGSRTYDDIFFGGRTKNPWNIEEYSTGSSAGPGSSTSAGVRLLFSHLKAERRIQLSA